MKFTYTILLFTLLSVGCKKKDELTRKPDNHSLGSISFRDIANDPITTTISTPSNQKTLQVYTATCAPFGNIMLAKIFAWNGYYGSEFRALQFNIPGSFDNFPMNNPNVTLTYYKGLTKVTHGLFGEDNEFQNISAEDYTPSFIFPQAVFESKKTVTIPITFTQCDIYQTATDRKIRASIPSVIIGGDTLEAMEIDIQGYGGTATPETYHMTFDLNGKSCGSYDASQHNCIKAQHSEPGIYQLKGTFIADSRNPIVDLTFDFTHHSSKLAYTGPVGRHELSDGTGYTEIKITATDQNGKTYHEQKDAGFVRTYLEKPWYQFFDGVSIIKREGYILLEFGAELISNDGSVISIENGNAYYKLRW